MLGIFYCRHCQQKINQYGEIANALFEQICEAYVFSGSCLEFYVKEENDYPINSMLRLLETKGYVISTESNCNSLVVKPLGIESVREQVDDEVEEYCLVCFDKEFHECEDCGCEGI